MRSSSVWICSALLLSGYAGVEVQDCYRQQRVEYTMHVRLNTTTHHIVGDQRVVYYNHSPDTLHRVYYHLYFNAFRPGSMMDVRSRSIADPDPRVLDRIYRLKEDEIGYQEVKSLRQDGAAAQYTTHGTILEVRLQRPIPPQGKAEFQMQFEAQVPLQIRRAGRDNAEGVAYSMTQWYPKIAEYDAQGWHADQYVGREFFGVWGNFDVTIELDSQFMVAATGELQNADEIGYGYESAAQKAAPHKKKGKLTTWHFIAHNVHDFAWAADPEYVHTRAQTPNGVTLHFFYQPGPYTTEYWKRLERYAVDHFSYMTEVYGRYPYPCYSIIQGGDGGMEYPMCTLIVSQAQKEEGFRSLVETMIHEVTHSWFYGVLGTNEQLYPWMDEGFATFASNESAARLFHREGDPHQGSYMSYVRLAHSRLQEPLSTPSDRYSYNAAYSVASYSMGSLFLQHIRYLIGESAFRVGMQHYYSEWGMKHPSPNDFIRTMEKVSGLQLHWHLYDWVYSTKSIDYKVDSLSVSASGKATTVRLQRVGEMPMPIELRATYTDGSEAWFYIPLNETLGNKPAEGEQQSRTTLQEWNWVDPLYSFDLPRRTDEVRKVEIDPRRQMADIDLSNNRLEPHGEN